jgi:CheY-like chemotaxis protein
VPAGADFTGCRVLVVDDDARNVFALSSVLQGRGFDVITAENGVKAMEILNSADGIHLVLMDTMMPEMDGLSATQEIRNLPGFERLPIISLTAKAMKGDREKALEAGASDYVTKPVDAEKLLAAIHLWLRPRPSAGVKSAESSKI